MHPSQDKKAISHLLTKEKRTTVKRVVKKEDI
jgi:hypothetical protein